MLKEDPSKTFQASRDKAKKHACNAANPNAHVSAVRYDQNRKTSTSRPPQSTNYPPRSTQINMEVQHLRSEITDLRKLLERKESSQVTTSAVTTSSNPRPHAMDGAPTTQPKNKRKFSGTPRPASDNNSKKKRQGVSRVTREKSCDFPFCRTNGIGHTTEECHARLMLVDHEKKRGSRFNDE